MRISERADRFVAKLLAGRPQQKAEAELTQQMAREAVQSVRSRLRKRRQAVRQFSSGRK